LDFLFSIVLLGQAQIFTVDWYNEQSVYPLAKIAADFNSATFNSILQNFGEHKFVNFSLKFVD
jgi:hypothetical protein